MKPRQRWIECWFSNAAFGIGSGLLRSVLVVDQAPKAFTKSGKRKISTMAKPSFESSDWYLPEVTSKAS